MTTSLDALAESHGIQIGFVSEMGERKVIDDDAKRALLEVLGVDPRTGKAGGFDEEADRPTLRCHVPDDPARQRCWGIACQLYSLRSQRNLGHGDFQDLGDLAEVAAQAGASFIGVNPLHALFFADPGRCSPYSPSSRRFLNPLYIAVDRLPGGLEAIAALVSEEPDVMASLGGDLIDYPAVGRTKRTLLRRVFDARKADIAADEGFGRTLGGTEGLGAFALFEALSTRMMDEGRHAGWHSWPEAFQTRGSQAVRAFETEAADDILFHAWLQYTAEEQLAEAQARARGAGMRIGLYLDFAVGVAPDGAETWADPEITARSARVGSPPDMFNTDGQDWGLAPFSPRALVARGYKPLADAVEALTRHAGAVRIDHAMGLARLWLIPQDKRSAGGGYVRYPLGRMVDTVAKASTDNRCLVIGEDLGTVPPGFRAVMSEAGILSYRVLYFERHGETAFLPASAYPDLSLACVSTHDLPTLAGWWRAVDIDLRAETGRQNAERTEAQRAERLRDRGVLLAALKEDGVLPERFERAAGGEDPLPDALDADLAGAVHRFLARAPSLLVAVQIEDMVGSDQQPNLPGTMDEYPNWRIRQSVGLEQLAGHPGFIGVAAVMREERPEPS